MVLILGDGLLGSELQSITGWDIISRKKNGIDFNDIESYIDYLIDWTDVPGNGRLGYTLKYSTVINCIANTDAYTEDASGALTPNYVSVAKLTQLCNTYKIKLVHISTEFVYANSKKPSLETDIPIPVHNWYGVSKLLGDMFIENNSNNYLICRVLHKQKNLEYPEVWNSRTSGDTVDKIAVLIKQLVNNNATGIFNVGTGDKYLRDIIKGNKEIPAPSHVPRDTRMDLTKLNRFLKNEI